MKRSRSILVALAAGCLLAWLLIRMLGLTAAIPTPRWFAHWNRSNFVLGRYVWWFFLTALPTLVLSFVAGLLIFKSAERSRWTYFAVVLPYLLLIVDPLFEPDGSFYPLTLAQSLDFGLSSLVFPAGLLVAYRLSGGRPPLATITQSATAPG